MLVSRSKIDYKNTVRYNLANNVQVHEQRNDSLLPRTAGAIALHPMINAQGSYHFLNLYSGKWIVGINWTVLPMPAEVSSVQSYGMWMI